MRFSGHLESAQSKAGGKTNPVMWARPWFCSLLCLIWSQRPMIFLLPHFKMWLSRTQIPLLSWLLFCVGHHSSHLVFIIIPENHNSDHSVDKKQSQRGYTTCPKPHSSQVAKEELSPMCSRLARFMVMWFLPCYMNLTGFSFPIKGIS